MDIIGNLNLPAAGAGQISNLVVEKLSSTPAFSSGEAGRLVFNTSDGKFYLNNGTAWVSATTSGDLSSLQTEVDNIETASGLIFKTDGTWDATLFSGFTNITSPTDLLNALSQLDSAIGSQTTTLAALTDTSISAATTGDMLIYDTGSWVNKIPASVVSNLGLVIGTNVQAWDADLDTLAALDGTQSNNVIISDGATWTQATPASARTALGLAIGTNVQAWDADLDTLAGLAHTGGEVIYSNGASWAAAAPGQTAGVQPWDTVLDEVSALSAITADQYIYGTGAGTMGYGTVTSAGRALIADATTASQRNTLGLVSGGAGDIWVDVAGDSMASGANITFSGGGEILGLPATPTTDTSAAAKIYVDNLVASGTKWKDPVTDPNLVDVVSTVPTAPSAYDTYIAYGGTYPQTWGTITTVAQGDVLTRNAGGTDYVRVASLAAGMRFIIAGEDGSIGSTLYGQGFRNGDLIQYVSGDPAVFANWTTPEDGAYQVVDFTVKKLSTDATGLANDSTVYTASVSIAGTPNAISITGSNAQTISTLISEINTDLTGATAVLAVEGHIHITADNGTDKIIISDTDLFSSLTDFSSLLAGIVNGTTVIANDPDGLHYSHTYLYTEDANTWYEIAGPGSIGAGTGLAYNGNVMNVNLGAGIAQLPTDEVGVDLYDAATGAIILTSDGSTRSGNAGDQLYLLLAGSTMTQDATGLYVAASGITETELNTSVAGAGLTGGAGTALAVNVDATTIEIATDTLQVKDGGISNAKLTNSAITVAGDTGSGDIALGAGLTVNGDTAIVSSFSGSVLSLAMTDATSSQKGVATFNTANFTVTSGDVTLNSTLGDLTNVDATTVDVNTASNVMVNDGTNYKARAIHYVYDGSTTSLSHVVTHNLDQQYCNVTVVDYTTDQVVIPDSITFDTANQLTVTFTISSQCRVVVTGL